jgi:hypothetical protein
MVKIFQELAVMVKIFQELAAKPEPSHAAYCKGKIPSLKKCAALDSVLFFTFYDALNVLMKYFCFIDHC